jgi:acyl carrier protein
MEQDIKAWVLAALENEMHIDIDRSACDDDTPLGPSGLDLESLAFVELTMSVEREYGVSYADADFERLAKATLGEFVADVASRRVASSAEATR